MLRALILATILTTWGTTGAVACFCGMITTEAALHRADAVFLGIIKSVVYSDPKDPGSKIVVEFEVTRVWKGPVTRKFEMQSIVETSFCEGFFKEDLVVGKKLLVFANRSWAGFGTTYSTNICTRTGPPERNRDTLKKLGEGRPPN